MKVQRKVKVLGVAVLVSVQLSTATPARAFGLSSLGSFDGTLSSFLDIAMPFLQDYTQGLFDDLSIGGVDLSGLITDAVFGSGGILSSGGLNLGGLMGSLGSTLGPTLSQSPFGQPLFNILSSAVTSGSIDPNAIASSGLLNAIMGQIQGNGSSMPNLSIDLSVSSGIFGNNGFTLQDILNGISSGTISVTSNGTIAATGSLNGSSGNGSGNSAAGTGAPGTVGSAGGVTGTGSTSCLYSNTCTNNTPYSSIFTAAKGVQGYPNPNEVRGQIYQEATSGRMLSDVFASNPNVGAYYAGNQSDREINRATTESFLSKAGQQLHQKTLDDTQKTVQGVTDLVKNCSKNAKSSQELLRCNLIVDGVGPSFAGAQLTQLLGIREDNQFSKIQLGDISASMDAERRQRDTENAGMSVRAMQSIWTTPDKW